MAHSMDGGQGCSCSSLPVVVDVRGDCDEIIDEVVDSSHVIDRNLYINGQGFKGSLEGSRVGLKIDAECGEDRSVGSQSLTEDI